MLMSGITENKEHSIYYFMFDIEKEVFTQERSDRKLIHPFRDRQGNRDYSSAGKIFCQLSEGKIKCFDKKTYYWDNLNIYLMKVEKNSSAAKSLITSLGCAGSKESGRDKPKEEETEYHPDAYVSDKPQGRPTPDFETGDSKHLKDSQTTKGGGSHLGFNTSKA